MGLSLKGHGLVQATLAIILGLLMSFFAKAGAAERPVLDLQVLEELPVYSSPDKKSTVISRLNRGDLVVISPKIYGAFRKVLVTSKGQPTAGYVAVMSIRRSQIRERKVEDETGRRPYNSKYALGVAFVPSHLRQGASTFQLSDSTIYNTSAFVSTSFFFSLFADVPLSPNWGLRPYVSFRTTNFKGTATQQGAPPGSSAKNITREQTLTGLGLVVKRYGSSTARWWWGGGAEIAMGSKLSVKISDIAVPTAQEDKPFFVMGFAALGADLGAPIVKSLYLVPDVRVGIIGTTDPMTFYVESFLGLAYLF